jgi:hypothetical protein
MNDGNYGGGPPDPEMMEDSEDSEATGDSEEVGAKSALLPKNMLPEGAKVGDTFSIRIDSIFDGEAEISVVSEETETEKPPMSANDEIDAAGAEMA